MPSKGIIEFLVVDDHPIFRQGLVALLESELRYKVKGQAGSAREAEQFLSGEQVDIILLDMSLGDSKGIDLIRDLKSKYPSIPILVISMHDELIYAERVLKAGASGYIMKEEAWAVTLEAIQKVLNGKVHVSQNINQRLLSKMYSQKDETLPEELLSDREFEVLEYMGQGYGTGEISESMNLSVKTVSTYRDHIKEKLQLSSAAQVRRYAVKWWQSRRT
ncbi:response regulator transcription factor [Spirochaeta isovalerica]|uniref:DNA-binding NarL/FixJ family response regulator n=1 Tax=Spirochaeta isovalerica TaxID=150 RepID=A0A841R7T5_9SPIO|nr:response regulator transcription factor [Spirochaeta isovalerica]MBB6479925.1 DNA-binding NarL/FixJ family response regulator [Spirochaeta isovalerica]